MQNQLVIALHLHYQTVTLASPQPLGDNQWGIAIPGQNGFNNDVSDYQSADSQILQATKWAAVPTSGYVNDRIIMKSSGATSDAGDSQVVMYGANRVGFVLAGSYSTNVTYTATAFVQAAPSLGYFDTGNDTTYADIYHYGGDSALGTKPTWWEDWISRLYERSCLL